MASTSGSKEQINKELKPVQFGPWPLGVNNREGAFGYRDIKPTELVACKNMDIHESGVLENRRGFAKYDVSVLQGLLGNDTVLYGVVGSVKVNSDFPEGIVEAFDPTTKTHYIVRTSINNIDSTDFITLVTDVEDSGKAYIITSVARYNGVIYFLAKPYGTSTFAGGFYYGSADQSAWDALASYITFTSIQNMLLFAIDSSGNIFTTTFSGLPSSNIHIVKMTSDGTTQTTQSTPGSVLSPILKSDVLYYAVKPSGSFPSPVTYHGIYKESSDGTSYTEVVAGVTNIIYTDLAVDSDGNIFAIRQDITSGYRFVSIDEINNTYKDLGPMPYVPSIGWQVQTATIVINPVTNIGYLIIEADTTSGESEFEIIVYQSNNTALDPDTAPDWEIVTLPVDTSNGVAIKFDTLGTMWLKPSINKWGFVNDSNNVEYVSGIDTSVALIAFDSDNNIIAQKSLDSSHLYKADYDPDAVPSLNSVSTMPAGDFCFIFKDRMWIVDKKNSKIWYSKATDPTVWDTDDGAGFFEVSPGDGQIINDVVVAGSQIYIFKETASWVFSFTADPGTDGLLQSLSTDRGAYSACVYNNIVYIVGLQGIQRLVNGYFIDIALQVKEWFYAIDQYSIIDYSDNTLYVTIIKDNYNDSHILVMNLITGAWSSYDLGAVFDTSILNRISITHLYTVGYNKAIFGGPDGITIGALTSIKADTTIYRDVTEEDFVVSYMPHYNVKTAFYDFQTPLNWKKMNRLLVDMISDWPLWDDNPYDSKLYIYPRTNNQIDTNTASFDQTITDYPLDATALPVENLMYSIDLGNEPIQSFRFQVVNFEYDAPAVGTDNQNKAQILLKRFYGYITQKIAKGDGIQV